MINKTLAQAIHVVDPGSTSPTLGIAGPLPLNADGTERFSSLGDIINAILGVLFPLVLVVVFLYLVLAGFEMATSLGNAEKIKKSKARITNAVVGLALLSVSYWLAQIVTKIFWK
jgi:hypothetical protein